MSNILTQNDDGSERSTYFGAGVGRLAKLLAAEVLPTHPDGFTFCPWRLKHLFAAYHDISAHLYIVSLAGFERVISAPPDETEIRAWIVQATGALKRRGHYIGGWRKGPFFLLDVSIAVRRLDRALCFARSQRQQAIYHPATGEEVKVI